MQNYSQINNNLKSINTSTNNPNINNYNINEQSLENKNVLLNKKRFANIDNDLMANHNIFGVQNNANLINMEKEKEEKQMKLKAKKQERKNKELNAIETKKTNAKESLDMAFGFSNNINKMNLGLNENIDFNGKKVSDNDLDSSDLSSEE